MAVSKDCTDLKWHQDTFQWGTNQMQYMYFTEGRNYEGMIRIYLVLYRKNNQEGSPRILFHSYKILVHILSSIGQKKECMKFEIPNDLY